MYAQRNLAYHWEQKLLGGIIYNADPKSKEQPQEKKKKKKKEPPQAKGECAYIEEN